MLFATMLVAGLQSCKKYNDWQTDESNRRLFRPLNLTATVEGVQAVLNWSATPGTTKYVVEVSKDSLQFGSVLYTYETEATKTPEGKYTFAIPEFLDATTRYSARIRGVGEGIPESNWSAVTFLTRTEQIMSPVNIADIGPRQVTLYWQVPNPVTHFMIGTTRYDITAAEKTSGAKTITGLTPKTTYTALLYNNTAIRGSQIFTTKADIPTGANVIEVGAADDLAAMLADGNINKPGTIFVLFQGSVYKADAAIVLPEGASFTIWGEDGPQKPVLAFNGITLPASAGIIKFENIDITGYQDNNAAGSKRNYIFNQSTASNTDQIIFENCIVRNFVNTPLRIQSSNPITIGQLVFNKSIVYDIGDNNSNGTYALVHSNVATGKINNIQFTNSTFYKIGYGIILHNAAPSQSVTIENNTFYNTVGNGRYFIDYNAQATGTFLFNNNIIGKTLSPTNTARGVRAATTPSVNNSYQTSDAIFTSNLIAGVVSYSGNSGALFTDPDTGNFLIKDGTFAGASSSGDPRWRR